MNVGDVVYIQSPLSSKSYLVKITKIVNGGIYGYRVKQNGERYKGNLGEEGFFSDIVIQNSPANVELKYNPGDICLMYVPRESICCDVGEIVRCTTRTVYIQWRRNEKPTKYQINKFYYGVRTRNEVQRIINGEYNNDNVILNQATLEAKERFDELGFDTSKLIVVNV